MVYYPLQLLQRVGVREVLLVTGQQHAGQFIDLLGNGHVASRDGDEVLFDLDLSYKVQVEAGGIAQVVGMARDFAAGEKLVVCLGDNIFEHAQARRDPGLGATARSSSRRRYRTRRTSASSSTATTERSPTSSRRQAWSTRGTTRRRRPTRSSASTATRPTSSTSSTALAPSSRGELEITDVNRAYAERGGFTCGASRAGGTTAASTGPTSPRSAA